ncbi:MAG: gliding motility-associated C-terminal domain-containing protein [Bacteroidetes bacterium]|nr:gliding motility-associated C-terminal domain-containing protein [Bacteroidota bacterium]
MKRFSIFISAFILFLVSFSLGGYSEGSKQLNKGCLVFATYLYICNDFTNHCTDTNGIRSQFAAYDATHSAPDDSKLCFVTRANEVVYMGFNGSPSDTITGLDIVYRICDSTGAVVYTEDYLPKASGSTGFITYLEQACEGPNQISSTGTGYDAIEWTPPRPGTYYIEFSEKYDGSFYYGRFLLGLLDITIYDNATSLVKPGRLYSKAWQCASIDFTGINFILSDDGIVTSAEFAGMNGGGWIQYANQTGCGNTNWVEDRKSLFNRQALFPQYKVFLSSPDPDVFPIATSLGQIIPPDPSGTRSCDGTIDYIVNVDKAGNVQIQLDFTPSTYITRVLNQVVIAGSNTIHWDGKDGSGVEVPNNVVVALKVTYINGLTNLPLYDVEGSDNGILVSLVAPTGDPVKVYWDDSNIWNGTCTGCMAGRGPNTVDVKTNVLTGGCSDPIIYPPGCHKWPSAGRGWGNLNTINSWWYTVTTSSTYPSVTEWRSPKLLAFVGGPLTACAGTTGVVISVNADPNTDDYHWGFTGTGVTFLPSSTTTLPSVTMNFSLTATPGDITVYGTNTNCSSSPSPLISLPVTITAPIVPPDLGPDRNVCPGPQAVLDAGSGYVAYLWSTNETTRSISAKQSGIYWVRVGQNGCTASDSVNLVVLPSNPTKLKPDTAICEGQSYLLDPGKNFTSILWSNGDTSKTITITTPGNYWVHTVDINNCPGADTVRIALKPAINVHLARDTSLCSGSSIVLHATFPGAAYLWQDGSKDSLFTVTDPGTYWVRVSHDSCAVMDTSTVHYCLGGVYFPTAFAPGSVVGNNYFHPLGPALSKFTLSIFDRWGQQIFMTDNPETGWDGTSRGSLCSPGVYVYMVSYELPDSPGTTIKARGTVTLVR